MSVPAQTDPVAALQKAGPLDPSFRHALGQLPRDLFVAVERAALERDRDHRLVREGRLLLPLETLARLLQALRSRPGERMLVVGAGVGYAAAALARLGHAVEAVEAVEPARSAGRRAVESLGLPHVRWTADLDGAGPGPFDGILALGNALPSQDELRGRLAVDGRLVVLGGSARTRQGVVRVTRREDGSFVEERLGDLRYGRRLGDILVEQGSVDRELLEELAAEADRSHRRLGEALVSGAKLPEGDLYRALAAQRGLAFGSIDTLAQSLDPELSAGLSRAFLVHHGFLPVMRRGDEAVLATCDPDLLVADLVQVFHPAVPRMVLVTPTDYRRLWETLDQLRSGPRPVAVEAVADEELRAGGEARIEARYVALFESLLLDAIGERASDIHLERYAGRIRVRIRVDGELVDVARYRLSPQDLLGIVNVVKIRANLDIAERRLPQGGRIRVKTAGTSFDLRVQTQPSLHGEHVVVRLLPQDVKLLTIEDLGFAPDMAAEYRRLLRNPSGLVLVVGPTGSGKTTTLYAGLQILAKDATRKVITVEDPIEYAIEDIQQTQVRPEIGFAFAHAMRSFVRQDPDVILVGEIRDAETALEAIRASQTGHLVLSTLHCNDTTDAVQRLIDLGMHPNSIASELLAVVSQRLARRICDGCRRPAEPEAELVREIFPEGTADRFFRGAGCGRCGNRGTMGRIAAVEFLSANAALREAIARKLTVGELRRLALGTGLRTMRDSALGLARQGLIALDELPWMLSHERLAPER